MSTQNKISAQVHPRDEGMRLMELYLDASSLGGTTNAYFNRILKKRESRKAHCQRYGKSVTEW